MFNNFYEVHGIKHETTLSYPSKMNDKFERKDINFIEQVIYIMLNYGVALHLIGRGNLIDFFSM